MKLGEVALVRSGLVLSRKVAKSPSPFRYSLLSLRAMSGEGEILEEELDVFHAAELLKEEYLTRLGDIIVRLSAPYTAVLIESKWENIVVSSNFVIIRVDTQMVVPEYLAWYLNRPWIKRKIYKDSSSNMLGAAKSTLFRKMPLSLPSLEDQYRIGQVFLLARKESALLFSLAEQKKKYYEDILEQMNDRTRRNLS